MARRRNSPRITGPLLLLSLLAAALSRSRAAAAALSCDQCPNVGYQPVCAANSQAYANYCYAQCNGVTQFTFGDCDTARSGGFQYNYNQQFINYPQQVNNRNLAACSCPTYNQPVCAGGQQFANDCQARCSGYQQYTMGMCDGSYRYPFYQDSRFFYRRRYQNPNNNVGSNCQCPSSGPEGYVCALSPVSNIRSTYMNLCVATCLGARVLSQGSC